MTGQLKTQRAELETIRETRASFDQQCAQLQAEATTGNRCDGAPFSSAHRNLETASALVSTCSSIRNRSFAALVRMSAQLAMQAARSKSKVSCARVPCRRRR